MIEDEESILDSECLRNIVIDPNMTHFLDSDSDDSYFLQSGRSLSISPPPEAIRRTPSPVSLLTLNAITVLKEAKRLFLPSLKKSEKKDGINVVERIEHDPPILIDDVPFERRPSWRIKAMKSFTNGLDSSMILKSVSSLTNVSSKDSGFTEMSESTPKLNRPGIKFAVIVIQNTVKPD